MKHLHDITERSLYSKEAIQIVVALDHTYRYSVSTIIGYFATDYKTLFRIYDKLPIERLWGKSIYENTLNVTNYDDKLKARALDILDKMFKYND